MGKNAFDYERQSIPLSHRNASDYDYGYEHEHGFKWICDCFCSIAIDSKFPEQAA
ncbi:MAG: hypothetical protein RLZZ396_2784 [Planctomycetota bacterium]|jgi:hypothetical protein